MLINNADVTGSLTYNGVPYNTGSFTGSFRGDGSQLTGITGGSTFPFTGSATISGSLTVNGNTNADTFVRVSNSTRNLSLNVDNIDASIELDGNKIIKIEPSKTTISTDLIIEGANVSGSSFSGNFIGNLTGTASLATDLVDPNYGAYSPGIISGSEGWSQSNNGTITLPTVQVALYDNPYFRGKLRLYTVAGGTSGTGGIPALTDNATNYIFIDYNSGTPIWGINTTGIQNNSSIITYMIVYRLGNFIHTLEFGDYGAGLPTKIEERIVRTDRFARESGLILGLNTSSGLLSVSSGVAWNGPYRQELAAVSSNDVFFEVYHTGGQWTASVLRNETTGSGNNTLNNRFYDNGTNLVVVGSGKYLINWYYRGQETNDHLYEVISTDEYDSVAEAQLAGEPAIPELVSSHGILVGRIIVQSGSFNGAVESAFTTVFQATSVTAHNDLTGIQGGTAGQYFHLTSNEYSNLVTENTSNTFTQSQTITGSLNLTGNVVSQGRVTSAQGFTGSFTGSFIGDGSGLTGIPGGGGGTPGGNNTEVQFNNAGNFGGAASVEIESGNLRLVTNEPIAAPVSGGLILFSRNIAQRNLPAYIGPSGLDSILQPFVARNKVSWFNPPGNSTTVQTIGMLTPVATGTATAANVAATNIHTSIRRLEYAVTTANPNAIAGARIDQAQYYLGDNTNRFGGFTFVARFGPSRGVASNATRRFFAGLTSLTGAPGTGDISAGTAFPNIIGVGTDSGDATFQVMHRTGTGAVTKVNTGISKSYADNTEFFDLSLFTVPSSSATVGVEFTRLSDNTKFRHTISSSLPAATTLLTWQIFNSTGGTNSVVGVSIGSVYIETDF